MLAAALIVFNIAGKQFLIVLSQGLWLSTDKSTSLDYQDRSAAAIESWSGIP